jgi:hypothetical protein
VFVGFGNNEINESDIEGKIVVCSQGSKELFTDWKWEQTGWSNYSESKKFSKLAALAPKAIIMVLLPNDKAERSYKNIERWMNRERYTLKTLGDEKQVPVLLAPASFGEMFVNKSSSYRKALKKYATTGSLHHFRTHEQRLNLRIGTNFEHTNAQNVMGWIEGSDPLLKDEYVVFVAHYDHLGVASDGDVYNGADDNGSGTVAIMEVAKAFSQLEVKPKRSIVFLWVTCEEIGHLGSTYYSDNPVFPLEKTVAAINLDMVGRVYDGPRDDVWEKSPKKVKDFNGLYTLSNDIWPELAKINQEKCKQLGLVPDTSLPKERFLRSSDHYHFHKKGVPILNYATGYHADYHKPGDEVDKINFDKIKRVADLCFLVGYEIANLDSINF